MRFRNELDKIYGTSTYLRQEEGGGGGGGDEGDKPPTPPPPTPETMAKADVDRLVQQRVEETRRKAEKDVADALGVPIDEAKQIIADRKAANDKDKSEAQLAREAADKEKGEAVTAKAESATARHQANLERVILRNLPSDIEEDVIDKKVERIAKIVEVEIGADADTIRAAVKALKDEDPTLFGAVPGKKGALPPSDPKGKPPAKGASSEDGFAKGQERAKAMATTSKRSAFVTD